MKRSYSEKLKDPRWQKKRLEIMQRDNFQCQACCDDKETLHVHHSYYEKGKEPWEYPDDSMRCLCEVCHTHMANVERYLLRSVNRWMILEIAHAAHLISGHCEPEPGKTDLEWAVLRAISATNANMAQTGKN